MKKAHVQNPTKAQMLCTKKTLIYQLGSEGKLLTLIPNDDDQLCVHVDASWVQNEKGPEKQNRNIKYLQGCSYIHQERPPKERFSELK